MLYIFSDIENKKDNISFCIYSCTSKIVSKKSKFHEQHNRDSNTYVRSDKLQISLIARFIEIVYKKINSIRGQSCPKHGRKRNKITERCASHAKISMRNSASKINRTL